MNWQELIKVIGAAVIAIATFCVGRCTGETQGIPTPGPVYEGSAGQNQDQEQNTDGTDSQEAQEVE